MNCKNSSKSTSNNYTFMKINYDNFNSIFILKIQSASYDCKIVAGSIIQHVKTINIIIHA